MESKVFTSAVWESVIHMFDELEMAVYETIGRFGTEDGEQEVPRDNGRVEAILDLRVIEEQLRQVTYEVRELMEENQLAGDEQKEVSRSWAKEIRAALAPLVNSQPREILERPRPWSCRNRRVYFLFIYSL